MKYLLLFIFLGVIVMSGPDHAAALTKKRAAPAELPPIVMGNSRYTHEHVPNSPGEGYHVVIRSTDTHTNATLWQTTLYSVTQFKPNMEADKQFIELSKFQLEGEKIIAEDEAGRAYEVDARTGDLLSPAPRP